LSPSSVLCLLLELSSVDSSFLLADKFMAGLDNKLRSRDSSDDFLCCSMPDSSLADLNIKLDRSTELRDFFSSRAAATVPGFGLDDVELDPSPGGGSPQPPNMADKAGSIPAENLEEWPKLFESSLSGKLLLIGG
jgi:hypothetical protein